MSPRLAALLALVLAVAGAAHAADNSTTLTAPIPRVNTTAACVKLLGPVANGVCESASPDSCPEACKLSMTAAMKLINVNGVNLTDCINEVYDESNTTASLDTYLDSLTNCGLTLSIDQEGQACVDSVYSWWQDPEHPCSKSNSSSCSEACKADLEAAKVDETCYNDVLSLIPVAGAVEFGAGLRYCGLKYANAEAKCIDKVLSLVQPDAACAAKSSANYTCSEQCKSEFGKVDWTAICYDSLATYFKIRKLPDFLDSCAVKRPAGSGINGTGDPLTDLLIGIVGGDGLQGDDVANLVEETVGNGTVGSLVTGVVTGDDGKITDAVGGVVGDVVGTVKNTTNVVGDYVGGLVGSGTENLQNKTSDIIDSVGSWLGGLFN